MTQGTRAAERGCNFCHKLEGAAKKVIYGPGIGICGLCIGSATGLVGPAGLATKTGAAKAAAGLALVPTGVQGNCNFCGKLHLHPGALVTSLDEPPVRICNECLDLCNEIIESP